jgi:hypothetical protein
VEDSKWERWSALGGILFVVLILISAFMPGSPPKTSDSPAKIAKFVADNRDAIRWAAFVGALGTIALFWFLGAVWRILRRAEGGTPRLAVVAVAGAVFAASMAAVAAIILSTLGIAGVAGSGGASTTKFFYVLSTNIGVATALGIAVFLGAFCALILRTGVFPKVLGWFGALIALVAVVATASASSTDDTLFALTFVTFLGFSLWVVIISVLMLRGAGAEPSTA